MKKEETTPYIRPIAEGAVLGATVAGMVTPLLKWTNCKMNKMPMNWSRPFTGAPSYMGSIAPTAAVMFMSYEAINRLLTHNEPKSITQSQEAVSSILAGMFAGITRVMPEAIAQNQQLAEAAAKKQNVPFQSLPTVTVIQQIVKHNGLFSLGRGTCAVMGREGLYSQGYLFMMPKVSKTIKDHFGNQSMADLLAASITGVFVGSLTTPLHRLRSEKQLNLIQPSKPLSYPAIIKKSFQESQGNLLARTSGLFRGAAHRSVAVVCSTLLMYEGNEFLKKMR